MSAGERSTTMLDGVRALVARRRAVLMSLMFGGLLGGGMRLLVGDQYTATAAFIVSTGRTSATSQSLSDLAAQYGLAVPGTEGGSSAQFFSGLVLTREVLERVLRTACSTLSDSTCLLDYFRGRGSSRMEERALRRLRRALDLDVDVRTGILRLGVHLRDPKLAAEGANAFVRQLGVYSSEVRQEQGHAKRVFFDSRLEEVHDRLQTAELALRDFYIKNRQWASSPVLTYKEGLLRRQAALASELYLSLSRAVETARMEEVNTTPTITIVDEAIPPMQADGWSGAWIGIGALLGLIGTITWILFVEWLKLLAADGSDEAKYLLDFRARLWNRVKLRGGH